MLLVRTNKLSLTNTPLQAAVCMLFFLLGRRGGLYIRGVGAFSPSVRSNSSPTCCEQIRLLQTFQHQRQLQSSLGLTNCHHWKNHGFPAAAAPRTLTHRLFASSSNDNDDDGWKVPKSIHIPEESLDMSFVRSSGAGGQNVNKVNTQVQLRVLVDGMGWIPYEVRERLRQQESKRINKEGFLILQVQEFRTQTQNRKAAVDKLREMILRAWPRPKKRNMRTGISEKTKKQRREDKRKRSVVKESRRRVEY